MIIFELTTEMAIPKGFSSTQYILHRGFRGMPSTSLACKVLIGG